jgi:hypothetical protein
MLRMILNSREILGDQVACKICKKPASVVYKVLGIEEGCNDCIEYYPLCEKHRNQFIGKGE